MSAPQWEAAFGDDLAAAVEAGARASWNASHPIDSDGWAFLLSAAANAPHSSMTTAIHLVERQRAEAKASLVAALDFLKESGALRVEYQVVPLNGYAETLGGLNRLNAERRRKDLLMRRALSTTTCRIVGAWRDVPGNTTEEGT